MFSDVRCLAYAAILTWVMVMAAATLRTRWWSFGGLRLALSNRDKVPEPSPITARAERAARNMLENLVLFVAVVAAARLSGVPAAHTSLGASVFLWARLAYFPVYLAGITVLRTALWATGVIGMAIIVAATVAR